MRGNRRRTDGWSAYRASEILTSSQRFLKVQRQMYPNKAVRDLKKQGF
jgi:hypothetical protein